MAKLVVATIKMQIQGGEARPAPPVGPILGQHQVPIAEFCKQFNAATSNRVGDLIPVVISVFEDRSFTFVLKTTPTAELIKKELGIEKGSGEPHIEKVGKLTREQLKRIAEVKLPDLNTDDVEMAMRIVQGSARQMGVEVEE